jgi:hypothetical protein
VRTKYVVMALVLAVLAVAGVVGLVVLAPTSAPAAAPKQCGKPDEVDIYVHNDAELPQIKAKVLAANPDVVGSVVAQTQQQTFEEFQHMFADQPDLLRTTRPDALPAVVKVWPKAGASASGLGDRLTQQFPPPAEIHRLICHELQQR